MSSFVGIQTVLCPKIFHANLTLVRPVAMVHLKVLLHVSYMSCDFITNMTQQAVSTLLFRNLRTILIDVIFELLVFCNDKISLVCILFHFKAKIQSVTKKSSREHIIERNQLGLSLAKSS